MRGSQSEGRRGRPSRSRKPNLQNQPALEKDRYKIRAGFRARPGCTLVVADYGQLELRLLAHITNCRSMLDAFAAGGDFHSRTAEGMFPYIREAIAKGEILLDEQSGAADGSDAGKPLLKDVYGSERRKAKTLNFSIAYGKTAHGLSNDWGLTVEEAQSYLEAWYADRPEVLRWQQNVRRNARRHQSTSTLMGRQRLLPGIVSANKHFVGNAGRAAINTPIQGGAADVVMMAMIKLQRSETLKELGWTLLLQIHDEVILEGPKGTEDLALAEVVACMEDPCDGYGLGEMRVALTADAKSADTWYEAK